MKNLVRVIGRIAIPVFKSLKVLNLFEYLAATDQYQWRAQRSG